MRTSSAAVWQLVDLVLRPPTVQPSQAVTFAAKWVRPAGDWPTVLTGRDCAVAAGGHMHAMASLTDLQQLSRLLDPVGMLGDTLTRGVARAMPLLRVTAFWT